MINLLVKNDFFKKSKKRIKKYQKIMTKNL